MAYRPDPENARLYCQAHRELMAMYERLVGRTTPDPAGTDPATTMLPPIPPLDEQSLAYRGMTDADAVPDNDIRQWISRAHEPLDVADDRPVASQILLPADYEAASWDRDRVDDRPAS
jgi:hypothetical protein